MCTIKYFPSPVRGDSRGSREPHFCEPGPIFKKVKLRLFLKPTFCKISERQTPTPPPPYPSTRKLGGPESSTQNSPKNATLHRRRIYRENAKTHRQIRGCPHYRLVLGFRGSAGLAAPPGPVSIFADCAWLWLCPAPALALPLPLALAL